MNCDCLDYQRPAAIRIVCPHKVYTIQVAKKSAKYTAQQPAAAGAEDAVADDDDADDNALQTFSKSQHWQLVMQQLSAI